MGNMKEYSAPQAEVINFDKDYVATGNIGSPVGSSFNDTAVVNDN